MSVWFQRTRRYPNLDPFALHLPRIASVMDFGSFLVYTWYLFTVGHFCENMHAAHKGAPFWRICHFSKNIFVHVIPFRFGHGFTIRFCIAVASFWLPFNIIFCICSQSSFLWFLGLNCYRFLLFFNENVPKPSQGAPPFCNFFYPVS